MKKLMFLAVMAIVAAGFTACGNSAPKASLKTDVDTMSYAIGMAQTQGLREYLVNSLGVDTAYMSDFIKGLNEGVNLLCRYPDRSADLYPYVQGHQP